jgi:hypothetical protein
VKSKLYYFKSLLFLAVSCRQISLRRLRLTLSGAAVTPAGALSPEQ